MGFNSNKTMKLIKIKQIQFKTIRYLLNMLSNDNKFILITEELWDIIGNKAEKYHYPMEYKIDKDTLIIDLKEGKKLSFYNRKNNIIDKYNYKSEDLNYDAYFKEINKINKDINEYFNFEKEFIESLSKQYSSFSLDYYKKDGYLINKK